MEVCLSVHSESYGALDLHQGFGARLTDNGVFLLNDLGSKLCIEKKGGKKRKTHPTERWKGG